MLKEMKYSKLRNLYKDIVPKDNKISVFALPLDLEILTDTSDIYDPLWA